LAGDYTLQTVNDFNGRRLPEAGSLAGYAALMDRYALRLPLPPRLTAIATRHHPVSTEQWLLLTPAHCPDDSLAGHLEFALKWEGVDLGVLVQLFRAVTSQEIAQAVSSKPTGIYSRKLWFLYEWLMGLELDLPLPGKVRAVTVVDPKQQFALEEGRMSSRHRVIDNLPGTRAFCPMVRKTSALSAYGSKGLDQQARSIVASTHADVMTRAAAFLLLSDSKSSFRIEGERPSVQRTARWGRAIREAGTRSLSLPDLERLQQIVIGDDRFVRLGLRTEGGFVGMHDRQTQEPIPDHISARPQDLRDLIEGVVSYDAHARGGGVDPVVAAASAAFGFVYIHPFVDGNGRLHRWLIHHVLAAAGYNPPGVVFPISAAILREIAAYRGVLESYSKPLLEFIEWRPTLDGNVDVLNDTADYYRYFDATAHAEFLYRCVQQTVEHDLPEEVAYLQGYDQFVQGMYAVVDMPNSQIELLHRFLRQGNGKLSKRALSNEFAAFDAKEVDQIEGLYSKCFPETGIPDVS
jgi:hypothetical protein